MAGRVLDRRTLAQAPNAGPGPVWRKGHYPEFWLETFRYIAEQRRWTSSHDSAALQASMGHACDVLNSISAGSVTTDDGDLIRCAMTLSTLVKIAARYADLIDAAAIVARRAVQPGGISDKDRENAGRLAKSLTRLAR